MPSTSNLAQTIPASPIRRLAPFAEAAKDRGLNVLHLNIGQPDIETPQVVKDAIKNFNYDQLAYLPSEGSLNYRENLCKYYANAGANVKPEEIILTNGGSESLQIVLQCCVNPGEEIIVPEPFYANYISFCDVVQGKIVPITSTIEHNFALPPMEEFEKKITPKTKAILLCNPNNPTGYIYSTYELESLKELAIKYNLYLIVDEVYREFFYEGSKPDSVLSLNGLEDNAILIDSISKRYSMCGARIGMIVTRNKKVLESALKFAQARLSVPTLSEVAANAALDTPQEYFVKVVSEYKTRRDVLVDGLNKIPRVVCNKPAGAFYVIAELPVSNAENFCIWMLEKFSHNNATVMLAPASGFYSNPDLGENQVRLAYVLNTKNLQLAIECLKLGLELYKDTFPNH
jgi:aspartate aminotransferase